MTQWRHQTQMSLSVQLHLAPERPAPDASKLHAKGVMVVPGHCTRKPVLV